MNRFDDAADKAAEQTDEELREHVKKITEVDPAKLGELFPEPADLLQVDKLIAAVNRSTTKNELANAFKQFGAGATAKAVDVLSGTFKIAKKVMLALALLIAAGSAARAAEGMTFTQFIAQKASETKGFYSMTWDAAGAAKHSGGAYVPIHTLHSKDKALEYFDWGLGVMEPEGTAKPRFAVPIMLNVVDLGRRLFSFRLAREHVRTTALPKTWLGPIWYPPSSFSKGALRDYVLLQNIGVGLSARFSGFLPDKKETP